MKCRYSLCKNVLSHSMNGNRKYCNYTCYYSEKLIRNKIKYSTTIKNINELKHSGAILKIFYNQFGSKAIDANLIRKISFNWQLRTALMIKDSETYTSLLEYSYILFYNKTIKIIKNESI